PASGGIDGRARREEEARGLGLVGIGAEGRRQQRRRRADAAGAEQAGAEEGDAGHGRAATLGERPPRVKHVLPAASRSPREERTARADRAAARGGCRARVPPCASPARRRRTPRPRGAARPAPPPPPRTPPP